MPNPSKAKSWIFRIIQPSDGYLPSRIFVLVIMLLSSLLMYHAEHDRLLREQAELLQSISEKLEQVERRVSAPKS